MSGEITKNVFTLYQVQKRKLKERRENMEKDKDGWKSYFVQGEQAQMEEEAKGQKGVKRMKSQMITGPEDALKKAKKKEKKAAAKKKAAADIVDYQAEINAENRQAEEDDVTSDSSSDSSSSSDEDNNRANKKHKHQLIVREEDYEENEELKFTSDVYNYTICANMTKCCSPLQ